MLRLLLLATSLIFALPAHAITVLTSIKPIQMIVNELTLGVAQTDVILSANASPHDYALKPSDVKKVQAADLVVWYGRDLEAFLAKLLSDKNNVLELSKIEGLPLIEFGDDHHDHHDHGHDHGSHDPHIWLGVEQASHVAKAVTQELIKLDAKNKATYLSNLESFEKNLAQTDTAIKAELESVADKGYYVFHDAYSYFEQRYALNKLGHFTVSPERRPGAKTLIKIRKTLKNQDVQCVFSEPQFTPAVIESVVRGSDVTKGELDPIGSSVIVKPGSYFEFLRGLSTSFKQCLS